MGIHRIQLLRHSKLSLIAFLRLLNELVYRLCKYITIIDITDISQSTSIHYSHWMLHLVWLINIVFISQDTFARAKTWVKELQRQASPNIVIALSGNKADMSSKRMVEYDVRHKQSNKHVYTCRVHRKHSHMLRRTVYYLWKHQRKLQ